jgi:hypothetical protein
MSGRGEDLAYRERVAWLLVLGQRLRVEYGALAMPLPRPLAMLLAQLQEQDQRESATGPDGSEARTRPKGSFASAGR